MKFGGALLASASGIMRCANLVKSEVERGNQVVVVVSAVRGVTDRLLTGAREIIELERDEAEGWIEDFCTKIGDTHLSLLCEMVPDQGPLPHIDEIADFLKEALAAYHDDRSEHSLDAIASIGERFSAPLFSLALSQVGIESRSMLGGEAGIITDSNYRNAVPDMDMCRVEVRGKVGLLLDRGITPVITGFVARDQGGRITTLGRGGSDYTASILGACLDSDEIWIWKDVGGIMTANPDLIPEARTVPRLSYTEAAELAHFGAEVLHPKTMAPAMEGGIPIRVKDSGSPESGGTLISEKTMSVSTAVKAVTSIDRVGLVSVSGTEMAGVPGVAASVFDRLADAGINVMMISQSSSEINITLVVPGGEVSLCRRTMARDFEEHDLVEDIEFDEDISIISVVGAGMRGTPGVAAKVFQSVADAGINVIMIAQGSSEVNISFVVSREDSPRAVEAIHRSFKLGQPFQ